jgi:hypothetical protein
MINLALIKIKEGLSILVTLKLLKSAGKLRYEPKNS